MLFYLFVVFYNSVLSRNNIVLIPFELYIFAVNCKDGVVAILNAYLIYRFGSII